MKEHHKPLVDKATSEFQGIVEGYIADVEKALRVNEGGGAKIAVNVSFKDKREGGERAGGKARHRRKSTPVAGSRL